MPPCAAADDELLVVWKRAFRDDQMIDPLALADDESLSSVRTQTTAGSLFVLEADGAPVLMCSITARTPERVQLGGVWTPPHLRARGFERAVVAGVLLQARSHGASTGVLFTPPTNAAAQRAYKTLGRMRRQRLLFGC